MGQLEITDRHTYDNATHNWRLQVKTERKTHMPVLSSNNCWPATMCYCVCVCATKNSQKQMTETREKKLYKKKEKKNSFRIPQSLII